MILSADSRPSDERYQEKERPCSSSEPQDEKSDDQRETPRMSGNLPPARQYGEPDNPDGQKEKEAGKNPVMERGNDGKIYEREPRQDQERFDARPSLRHVPRNTLRVLFPPEKKTDGEKNGAEEKEGIEQKLPLP